MSVPIQFRFRFFHIPKNANKSLFISDL